MIDGYDLINLNKPNDEMDFNDMNESKIKNLTTQEKIEYGRFMYEQMEKKIETSQNSSTKEKELPSIISDKQTDYLFDYLMNDEKFNG